jgi:hypothetical protein
VLTLALEQLRAVGAQLPLGIDEAVERLARDAQLPIVSATINPAQIDQAAPSNCTARLIGPFP